MLEKTGVENCHSMNVVSMWQRSVTEGSFRVVLSSSVGKESCRVGCRGVLEM